MPGWKNGRRTGREGEPVMEPKRQLLAGVRVLDPVLGQFGFIFELEAEAKGSGGPFASGSYRKGDRALELHFRHSLGLVRYYIGKATLDHESYMRFVGAYGRNQYPDFPLDPLESFVHLANDINAYCSDFVSGDGRNFTLWAQRLSENPGVFRGIAATG
jgi:hypothetical protein